MLPRFNFNPRSYKRSDKDLTKAGKILSEHLKYGGSMDEVMEAFTEAMKTAGFGEEAEEPPKSGGKKTKAATE